MVTRMGPGYGAQETAGMVMHNGHSGTEAQPAGSNRQPLRILVTAFGAFPGAPSNPTEAILRRLQRERFALAGIELRVAVMPVSFAGVDARLRALLAAHRPDIVVHLGLAGRRRAISIETQARNRLTVLHPDADGATNKQFTVTPHGPPARASRWNPAPLVNAIRQEGISVARSRDAGDYLCNQTLYLTLGLFDGPAGFIHVPRLRRRRTVGASKRAPLPSLVEATRAVIIALRLMARDLRLARNLRRLDPVVPLH